MISQNPNFYVLAEEECSKKSKNLVNKFTRKTKSLVSRKIFPRNTSNKRGTTVEYLLKSYSRSRQNRH